MLMRAHIAALRRRRSRGDGGGGGGLLATFTGADSAVTTGPADTGQAFTVLSLGTPGVWGRRSNRAYAVDVGGNYTFLVADSGLADGTLSCKLYNIASSNGLVFRVADKDNLFMVENVGGFNFQAYRRQAGGWVGIAAGGTGAWVSGDELQVVRSGTSLSFRRNGAEFMTATSAFNIGETKVGLAASNPATEDWDDLTDGA